MSATSLGKIRGTIEIDYDGAGVIRATDDVDDLSKRSEKARGNVDLLAKGMGAAALIIAGGFAVAAKSVIDFDKRLSAIKAVSGATGDEMDRLRAKALQLGSDTSFSASEAALAMEELVKAGLSVEEVLNGAADATVALAAAGEVDLPAAAAIASNAMNQFGLAAKDLPRVADLIAGAANASAIDVGEFGFSLSQVGAVAHLAGQTFEDTATAIALLGNAGIKGSDAGTSLKTFLSNLVPTTNTAKNAFKELGLVVGKSGNAFIDAKGNYKSLADIAGILNKATAGLSESQKQVALETIFGSDAIRAAAVIAENGAVGFNTLRSSMNELTAAEVAATRLDNTAGSIEQLKGSAETLAITIGTMLVPKINAVVAWLQKAVNWFNSLSSGTKNTVINVLGVTAALAAVVGVIIKVSQAVKALQAFIVIMKAWAIWANIVSIATKVWTAAQWLWNAAISANPIGLIIIAIIALIALVVLLWKKNETFRKIVLAAWEGIKNAVGAVVDWFMNSVLPILKSIWEGIAAGFKWLMNVLGAVWNFIKTGIEGWVMVFQWVWGIVGPLVKAIFGLIVSVIQTAWSIISALFAVWKTVMDATVGAAFRFLWSIVSWAVGAIKDNVVTAFNFIVGFLKWWWGIVSGVFTAGWNFIVKTATAAWDWFMGLIAKVWSWIGPYVMAAIALLVGIISTAWEWIKTTTSNLWNAIVLVITTVWNWILAFIKAGIARLVAIIDGIKAMVEKVKAFFNKLKEAASGGVGSLLAFVKAIPGKILDALGNVGKMLYDSGKKIIQGLIDGIAAMAQKLKDKASSILGGLRDLFPFSPAKKGPFSGRGWTLYSGMSMMEGLADGITRSALVPVDAATLSLGAVAAPMLPYGSMSTTTHSTRTVSIGRLELKGVLDPNDPASGRKMVAALHKALDDYERDYK